MGRWWWALWRNCSSWNTLKVSIHMALLKYSFQLKDRILWLSYSSWNPLHRVPQRRLSILSQLCELLLVVRWSGDPILWWVNRIPEWVPGPHLITCIPVALLKSSFLIWSISALCQRDQVGRHHDTPPGLCPAWCRILLETGPPCRNSARNPLYRVLQVSAFLYWSAGVQRAQGLLFGQQLIMLCSQSPIPVSDANKQKHIPQN